MSYANGSLTISPASLVVTGDTTQVTYSGAAQTNTFGTSGIVDSATVTSVSGLASATNVSTSTDALSGAVGTGLANYTVSYANGSLTISPASLVVTIGNDSRYIDTLNPIFSSVTTGFQGDDTLSNATNNVIDYSTIATIDSPTGNYAITASGPIPNNNNYIVQDIDGTLTVLAALPINYSFLTTPNINSQCVPSAPDIYGRYILICTKIDRY